MIRWSNICLRSIDKILFPVRNTTKNEDRVKFFGNFVRIQRRCVTLFCTRNLTILFSKNFNLSQRFSEALSAYYRTNIRITLKINFIHLSTDLQLSKGQIWDFITEKFRKDYSLRQARKNQL